MKKTTKLTIGIISVIAIICVAAVIVFTGTAKGKSEYEKHIAASPKYMDELNYEKAIAELELAIEIEPNKTEAYIALAEVYVQMEDYQSAVIVLEEAIKEVSDVNKVEEALKEVSEQEHKQQFNEENIVGVENSPDIDIESSYSETIYEDNGSYYVLDYNEKGYVVKETWYYADGSMRDYGIQMYNENGNIVKKIWYKPDGRIFLYAINEYDDKGNCVKVSNYGGDDKLYNYYLYEYDENNGTKNYSGYLGDGRVETIIEYDGNGNMLAFYYTYNEDGSYIVEEHENYEKVRETSYNADGTLK